MRVVVIGTARQRRDLRAALERSRPEVVAEFDSLAEARRSGIEVPAIVAPSDDEGADDGAVEVLTTREIQVLELLAEGLPNKAIAERLGISDQTVKFHIAGISGKLGAVNRTDAVRRAVRRGLITF